MAPAVLTTESTHVNLSASGSGVVSGASAPPSASASGSGPVSARHPPQLINQKASAAPSGAQTAATSSSHHHNGSGANGTGVAQPVDQGSGMRTIELSTGRIREGFGE